MAVDGTFDDLAHSTLTSYEALLQLAGAGVSVNRRV